MNKRQFWGWLFVITMLTIAVVGGQSQVQATSDGWTTGANMPTARSAMAVAAVNSKLYVVGGHIVDQNNNGIATNTLEIYDPATNTWTTGANMPTARSSASTGVINDKLYVIGGGNGNNNPLSTLEIYDPATNTWTTGTNSQTTHSYSVAGVINSKLYVVGGSLDFSTPNKMLEIYDPTTNKWTTGTSIPEDAAMGGVINGKLYVMGGCCDWNKLQIYDPATNTWTTGTNMPTKRAFAATGVINNKLYVAGGIVFGGQIWNYLNILEIYDPATNMWTTGTNMPTARGQAKAGVINGKLYVVGGIDSTHLLYSTLEIYDPGVQTPTVTPMPSPTATPVAADEPVIFIAGIAGSQLGTPKVLRFDNIWPFGTAKSELTLKKDHSDKNIYTDYAIGDPGSLLSIRGTVIYGPFIQRMESEGYLEYRTNGDQKKRTFDGCDTSQKNAKLFVFPWDWRYGAADVKDPAIDLQPGSNNVTLLKEYVDCVRKIHPNTNVIIVAHSMGGLLARKYILDNPGTHHVDKLITMGTPWLGAPKALAMMFNGDFMKCEYFNPENLAGFVCITPEMTRKLLEYFPGAHQLLPSWQYYELVSQFNYPFLRIDLSGRYQYIGYDQFDAALRGRYVSPDPDSPYPSKVLFMENNNKLFGNQGFSDWRDDASGVRYFVMYGERQIDDTIGQVTGTFTYDKNGNVVSIVVPLPTAGDNTVPLTSSTRKGNGLDLNGPALTIRFKERGKTDDVTHGNLPLNLRIQNCILKLLGKPFACDSDSSDVIPASTQDDALPARYVRLWGINSLRVSDGISTTENLMTNTLSLSTMFPDIVFNYLGDDAAQLIIPDVKKYTLTFNSGDYMMGEVVYGTGTQTLHKVRYTGTKTVSSVLSLATTNNELSQLLVDTNGDGIADTLVPPSGDLQGTQANDVVPPTVKLDLAKDTHVLTITGTDDNSGIDQILFSSDNIRFSPYTQPLVYSAEIVYAKAQDRAGNWSIEVSNLNTIYLPLIHK